MLLPMAHPELCVAGGVNNGPGRRLGSIPATLRRSYRDAVRLAAREEILADLADDGVTAHLHADTARFHHGWAHAYAKALHLLVGADLNVADDKQAVKAATRESDLASMRCQGRPYRPFGPHPA
jgi:hypothetical protein